MGLLLDFEFSWNDLGSCLMFAINESLKIESLSSPQKEEIIVLLPKGDEPCTAVSKKIGDQSQSQSVI